MFSTARIMALVFVEANIGAGKSTLLRAIAKRAFPFRHVVVEEPVDEWESIVDEDGVSLFKRYYADPKKYALMFQLHVLSTRVKRIKGAVAEHPGKVIFCERSLLSDLNIFVRRMVKDGIMDVMTYQVYKHLHDTIVSMSQLPAAKFIYLRVDPDTCFARVRERNRGGEDVIDIDFLTELHKLHEAWLCDDANTLIVDGTDDMHDVCAWDKKFDIIQAAVLAK